MVHAVGQGTELLACPCPKPKRRPSISSCPGKERAVCAPCPGRPCVPHPGVANSVLTDSFLLFQARGRSHEFSGKVA